MHAFYDNLAEDYTDLSPRAAARAAREAAAVA
jgi:hypothetical protein